MANYLGFVVEDKGRYKVVLDNPAPYRAQVAKLLGDEVILSLKKRPKSKTPAQLRYLRGVVIPDIAKACGTLDPDDFQEIYEAILFKLRPVADGPFGLKRRALVRDMSLEEVKSLIDDVILFAESTIVDCTIRRPEDVDIEKVADDDWE